MTNLPRCTRNRQAKGRPACARRRGKAGELARNLRDGAACPPHPPTFKGRRSVFGAAGAVEPLAAVTTRRSARSLKGEPERLPRQGLNVEAAAPSAARSARRPGSSAGGCSWRAGGSATVRHVGIGHVETLRRLARGAAARRTPGSGGLTCSRCAAWLRWACIGAAGPRREIAPSPFQTSKREYAHRGSSAEPVPRAGRRRAARRIEQAIQKPIRTAARTPLKASWQREALACCPATSSYLPSRAPWATASPLAVPRAEQIGVAARAPHSAQSARASAREHSRPSPRRAPATLLASRQMRP